MNVKISAKCHLASNIMESDLPNLYFSKTLKNI